MTKNDFLPISAADMKKRGWSYYDILLITGDAYVDHPSFGTAVIGRVLENAGFRVCVLAQPSWKDKTDFQRFGEPRVGIFIGAGNLDSMVAHYTAGKKKRSEDFYSPGKKAGLRPDRATIVYSNRAREAYPKKPIVIGGLEASLRRFAHYDYWEDKVRRSIIFDSKADILVYGMGERATLEVAKRLSEGVSVSQMSDIRGIGYIANDKSDCAFKLIEVPSFDDVRDDKRKYAEANMVEYDEHDPVRGKAVIQKHGDKYLIVNPPQMPLTTREFDEVSELPYMRRPHPVYDSVGGVPAIEEVKFSVIHNRGCFGACNFCSLAFHQGRMVTSRSHESVIREVTEFTKDKDFKGYVHDVGGPTANFRGPSCDGQLKNGMCKGKNCLTPTPCKNLKADHSDYLALLRKLRAIPGVKKVFVRSGIRFDYLMEDKNDAFFSELVKYHISGQLKVAPEHCINKVLDYMGKPHNEVYNAFMERYVSMNKKYDKDQYIVPYLISSHPGSTLRDAVHLAEYLHRTGRNPEQVQDFYPTPGTLSTCMYYTGIDPRTMEKVYVPKTPREKAMQRALLQWRNPENRRLIFDALKFTDRQDLIGYGPNCLIRPEKESAPQKKGNNPPQKSNKPTQKDRQKDKPFANARKKSGRGRDSIKPSSKRK